MISSIKVMRCLGGNVESTIGEDAVGFIRQRPAFRLWHLFSFEHSRNS
jgi:hypothetical protein